MKSQIKKPESKFIDEFKAFAFKGNVIDLAVGVIIGASFNKIVQSLVNDIIMPLFGALIGETAFENLYINLSGGNYGSLAEAEEAGAAVMKYGVFISEVINFLIVALVLFIILRKVLKVQPTAKKEDKSTDAKSANKKDGKAKKQKVGKT
jgi:large conductance mechanosensitive channel